MINEIRRKLFPAETSFLEYALRQANIAKHNNCFSRSANYITAIRAFTAAVGELSLRKVTASKVAAFQQHMQQKGIARNTMSCYNRTLRAIYNKAVDEGLVRDRRPFADAFTGRTTTKKRSIHEDCIRKLAALDLSGSVMLTRARDYFLFSFYAMGMPFVDLACLQAEQIVGNCIYYNRRKTGSPVRVPLCDEALAIVKRYQSKNTPFVFPIITKRTPSNAYRQYCSRLNLYNRMLKRLASLAGITENLSSYTVRHSWASIAYKSDAPLSVISQALGHHSTDITMTYIRQLDTEKLREGNERVLRAVTAKV